MFCGFFRLNLHLFGKNSHAFAMATAIFINRGVSGFDSLGHGHYYASYPNSQNNPAQPSLPQNNPNQQAPPRPFPQQSGHHDTSQQHSQHSQPSQGSYESDTVTGGGGGSNSDKGSYGANWNYINSNDRNTAHQGQHGYGQSPDKDSQR